MFSNCDTASEADPEENVDFVTFHNKCDVDHLDQKRAKFLDLCEHKAVMSKLPAVPSGNPEVLCPECGPLPAGFVCECGRKDESELMEIITNSINNDSKPKASDDYVATSQSFVPSLQHSSDNFVSAKFLHLDPSANIVTTADSGRAGETNFASKMLQVLLPFAYVAILAWFFPSLGQVRAASIMGFVHSLHPFIHIIATGLWSTGQTIVSCLVSSGCGPISATAWTSLTALGNSITSLPLKDLAAPILWSSLLLTLSFRKQLAHCEPMKVSRI